MSLPLPDLKRLKITPETRAWLYAQKLKTGRSQQEIVRDVLHELAIRELDGAKVLHALDPREARAALLGGNDGDAEGRRR